MNQQHCPAMPWVVITEQGLEVPEPSDSWTRRQAVQCLLATDTVASGWVLEPFIEGLERHHQRVLLNFRAGWPALAWTVASSQPEVQGRLRSFAPPSQPGPQLEAPFGCSVMSRRRCHQALLRLGEGPRSPLQWARSQHQIQPTLGPVFLDPRIELKLSDLAKSDMDGLKHRESSLARRILGGASLLFGGRTGD